MNVCFNVPLQSGLLKPLLIPKIKRVRIIFDYDYFSQIKNLKKFLDSAKNVFVIVSQISHQSKKAVVKFLKRLNFPTYLESISNLREEEEFSCLRIHCADKIWENSKKSNYIIDSVIKIGGTPTHRFWRDLR